MSTKETKEQELERLRLELRQAWGDPWDKAVKERREEREKEKASK